VVSVDDGSIAWEFLQHGRYDVLLADVEMPEMSGLELVAKLRETGNDLPVVFVTGAASVAQVIPHLEFGRSWTLQKPFGIEQIRGGLRDALTTVGCWKEGPLWRRAEIGSA
jgi:DNA-binding response OmpR family regulator